jgi:hypothetical protein
MPNTALETPQLAMEICSPAVAKPRKEIKID